MSKIIDFESKSIKEYDENYKFASEFNCCTPDEKESLRYFVSSALIESGLLSDKKEVKQYQLDNDLEVDGIIDLKTARNMQYINSSKKMNDSIADILNKVEVEKNKQLRRGKIFFRTIFFIVSALIIIGCWKVFDWIGYLVFR